MLSNAAIVPYIPVKDVARARKFYEEKVGLTPKQEYAGGVIYECGNGSWACMYPSPGAGTPRASHHQVGQQSSLDHWPTSSNAPAERDRQWQESRTYGQSPCARTPGRLDRDRP